MPGVEEYEVRASSGAVSTKQRAQSIAERRQGRRISEESDEPQHQSRIDESTQGTHSISSGRLMALRPRLSSSSSISSTFHLSRPTCQ